MLLNYDKHWKRVQETLQVLAFSENLHHVINISFLSYSISPSSILSSDSACISWQGSRGPFQQSGQKTKTFSSLLLLLHYRKEKQKRRHLNSSLNTFAEARTLIGFAQTARINRKHMENDACLQTFFSLCGSQHPIYEHCPWLFLQF